MELFSSSGTPSHEPLAARMRPRTLDEYIGQDHIIGPGRLLRRAIQADQLTSVIFSGPPGTGKTTLARVIANHTKSNFVTLNAVLAGVQQIRDAIKTAEEQRTLYARKTILFVDEVHRWNRAQQDALLPWVENGTIVLIGATTENPFFEVNKALVSRSRVFQLKALTQADLLKAAKAAIADRERGYGRWKVEFEDEALAHLVTTASGDARSLLNALELAVETSVSSWPPAEGTEIRIDMETCEQSIQRRVVLYDRDGDYHYDVISAFIKSLRGRDPDAALYWLARMVSAGEDPGFIFRRMLISACEDTGLADPHAITVVESCAAAFDRVGLPEGQYHLAHAALYLSTAPKSNSSLAYFDALASIEQEDADVPNHLKDASRDKEGFGHGEGYIYPHAYRDHWAAQQYLPTELVGKVFYMPSTQGYEGAIREDVLTKRELQIAAIMEEAGEERGEHLTFSPGASRRDAWTKRAESSRSHALLSIRNELTRRAGILRHHRVLVDGADDGLLIWEAGRLAPEGLAAGLCATLEGKAALEAYSASLDELDRPHLALREEARERNPFSAPFDRILSRDPALTAEGIVEFARARHPLAAPGARLVLAARIPARTMRLASLMDEGSPFRDSISEAEERFYRESKDSRFSWDDVTLARTLAAAGFPAACERFTVEESRRPAQGDVARWLDRKSPFGAALLEGAGEAAVEALARALEVSLSRPDLEGRRDLEGRPDTPCRPDLPGRQALPWKYDLVFCSIDL